MSPYSWNFGDGTTATGPTASHAYATAGTYTVALTVVDNGNLTSQVSHAVTITDRPPTAQFTVSGGPTFPGTAVGFNGSGSSDSDGTVVSYSWNFGDGTGGSGATPSHAYAAAGSYTVTLTVTDNSGSTNATSQPVTVDELPTASFVVATAHPGTGAPVGFDGSSSNDPDGSITSYAWSFGDGTTGRGATPTHTYAAPGTYSVTLTVTDAAGGQAAKTVAVTVVPGGRISKIKPTSRGRVLLVTLSSPGSLFVGSSHFTVNKAGTVKAKVKLSGKQRKLLAHGHKVRLTVKIRFVPLAGPPMTNNFPDTIRP